MEGGACAFFLFLSSSWWDRGSAGDFLRAEHPSTLGMNDSGIRDFVRRCVSVPLGVTDVGRVLPTRSLSTSEYPALRSLTARTWEVV